MEEHDDWKLGDEGEPTPCPHCGKRNRAGLTYCIICGSPLGEDLESDPGSLRSLGEMMGGKPRTRRVHRRHSLRGWTIAAARRGPETEIAAQKKQPQHCQVVTFPRIAGPDQGCQGRDLPRLRLRHLRPRDRRLTSTSATPAACASTLHGRRRHDPHRRHHEVHD